jgi:antitoxin PrlF
VSERGGVVEGANLDNPAGVASRGDSSHSPGMIRSRLNRKCQTTIPVAVCVALGLRPGDELRYVIENGRVRLDRVPGASGGDEPFATFPEWGSELDKQAYDGL